MSKKNTKSRLDRGLAEYSKNATASLAVTEKTGKVNKAFSYAAAGLLSGLTLVGVCATQAEAAPYTFTPTAPIVLSTGSYINIDVNSDASDEILVRNFSASDYIKGAGGFGGFVSLMVDTGTLGASYLRNFSTSFNSITPSMPKAGGIKFLSKSSAGNFVGNVTGNIGFTFLDTTPSVAFITAWVNITNSPTTLTINSWGWDSVSAASIHAGPVGGAPTPEPASLALLAMGAAGIVTWRRKRQKKGKAELNDA